MDVEYYGPNPQMGFWYLGALRASEEMARYLGDDDFAITCQGLFENGSKWIDNNLFNGEYYEHQIRPPKDKSEIAPALLVGIADVCNLIWDTSERFHPLRFSFPLRMDVRMPDMVWRGDASMR